MSTNEQIMIPASELVHEYVIKSKIEELEKIKAEVNDIHNWCNPRMVKNDFIALLNRHISELKGENKQSICNNCINNIDELSGECYECVKGIEDWYEPISELKGENE